MKKNIIKLIVVAAVFAIGYKVVNYIFDEGYRQGFSKAFDVNEKCDELVNKKETIKDDLVPECSMNDCPEYKPMDVDGDGRYESVVLERTAMTQQAGRIWIIDDGKVMFISKSMAQIGVQQRGDYDKQENGFIISYATESPMAGEQVFKDSFKRDYYTLKDGKYILEKRIYQYIPKVNYYAKVKRVSTSGDIRFYWYDTELKQIKNPDDQYSWFFALPKDIPNDNESTDKWVKFIEDNKDFVFKITGIKESDDCDYYGPDHCIENIDIKKIEVVGTNKLMEF